MTERSEAVKEWLQGIDEALYNPVKSDNKELFDVYRLSNKFNKILTRMERDFEHHYKGDSQFSFFKHDEEEGIIKKHVDVINPTNHQTIGEELYLQMTFRIAYARHVIEYADEVRGTFMAGLGSNTIKELAPKLSHALMEPTHRAFIAIHDLLKDSKTLDLRDDYPALDAMKELIEGIDKTRMTGRERES